MLYATLDEARQTLCRLTMADDDGRASLPPIRWDAFDDDHSQDRVGYSFLSDQRNTWLEAGSRWVIRKITESETMCTTWIDNREPAPSPYRTDAVATYIRSANTLRTQLFILRHTLGGAPARSTEILSLRHINTPNAGLRNILVTRGVVTFMTSYHKGFRKTLKAKVIYRYLPREVGEILLATVQIQIK